MVPRVISRQHLTGWICEACSLRGSEDPTDRVISLKYYDLKGLRYLEQRDLGTVLWVSKHA